jgi:hypothetical protein
MANQDITIGISDVTVTSAKITITGNGSPQAGATYAVWYDDVSYALLDRDSARWYGGHVPITESEIIINGLQPGADYFVRVFEVDAGDSPNPGLTYDYSSEETLSTNETLENPRVSNPYCTAIPSDSAPGPGEQITESSTGIRIGSTYYNYGIGTVDSVAWTFEWTIGNSKAVQIYNGTSDYHDITDTDLPDLVAGTTISFTIRMQVTYTDTSVKTASVSGYTYVFQDASSSEDTAYVPSELLVEPTWQSMRPQLEKTEPDGPICYFAGSVRNNNHVGIGSTILQYTDSPTDALDQYYYTITSDSDAEFGSGSFVLDSDSNAPIIFAPNFDETDPTGQGIYGSTSVRFRARLERWKYNTHYPYVHNEYPTTIGPPYDISINAPHIATKTYIKADSAYSIMKFLTVGVNIPVLTNGSYSNMEPEYVVLKFTLPSDFEYTRGLIRSYVRLFARDARIDKSLTSTVFALACDEYGSILTGEDGEPAAFGSADIAFINYASHVVPVDNIVQYFINQGTSDIYIRLQLGATSTHIEHSGTDVTSDYGYVSFWGTPYGKEWGIEGDDGIINEDFDDNYAPHLAIFQVAGKIGEVDEIKTRITTVSTVPLNRQRYEYQRWNGIRMVDDVHDLVASYANNIQWHQTNTASRPSQPPGYDKFVPVYFVLRWGGFWGHILQQSMTINNMSELTENLGINELEEGLIYTGHYGLSFNTVGAILHYTYEESSTEEVSYLYDFIDRSTGRYDDFDSLGRRNTETIEQGGVSSGVNPGNTMHYYYTIVQHGIWGISTWSDEDWRNAFLSRYGYNMIDRPTVDSNTLTFLGSQINQDTVRDIVAGKK